MKELFKPVVVEGRDLWSAREVHSFLKVKSKFADWVKNRISDYQFIEGKDFVTVSKTLESGGREIDYAITAQMGKELSMVEKNEKGKEAREYFIKIEESNRKPIVAMSQLDFLQFQLDLMKQQDVRISSIEHKIKTIEAKSITHAVDYFAIMGYASLKAKPVDVKVAAELGRKAANMCKSLGYVMGELPDPRFGRVKTYPVDVLESVFTDYFCK
jgi:anti-repressor protein